MIDELRFELPKPSMGKPEITMAPLVDVVFLLLIFFTVTTVFPDDVGLMIEKPSAESAASLQVDPIVILLDQKGSIHFDKQPIDFEQLKRLLPQAISKQPTAAVIVHADRRATTEDLVHVIDVAKASGAAKLGISTEEGRSSGRTVQPK